jgi:hypothetical protein
MKARVTQVERGAGDGGVSLLREKAAPAAAAADGNEGLIHLVDGQRGTGVTITLWRDEQAEQASQELATGLREQAQNEGYDVTLIGSFDVDTIDRRGSEPHAARLISWSGTGDREAFVRDQVLPIYDPIDGFCGLISVSAGDRGIGISLWANKEVFAGAQNAMRRVGEAIGEAGYTLESADPFEIEIFEVRQGART